MFEAWFKSIVKRECRAQEEIESNEQQSDTKESEGSIDSEFRQITQVKRNSAVNDQSVYEKMNSNS